MKRIATCWLMLVSLPVLAEDTNSTYNFILTVDSAKKDSLLIGPENEDIHIGVMGRKFYPTDETKQNKAKWPEGKWKATVSLPDDPARVWWDYELSLHSDSSVTFVEIEHSQDYDRDFKPKGKQRTRTRLSLSGLWSMTEGKGVFVFNKETKGPTKRPNPTRGSALSAAPEAVQR